LVRTRIAEVLRNGKIGQRYEVLGWVRSRRDSKAGFSFIDLNDGSCLKNLQIIADKELPEYEERVLKAYTGCSLKVIGVLSESPARGQAVELRAEKVEIIGPVDPIAYPLQKKRHSFEFLRTIAHLRPRTNTFGAVARVRNAVSYAIHKFFQDRGFIYVHTPIITGSDCEGAGELFHVTSLDLQELAREGQGIDYSQDLFGKPANLTVSGQMEAEAYALALGNVYTFGPTFRAENSNTSRHLAEFWMVEPEMAFCDLKGNIEVAEQLLKFIFNWVLDRCKEDLEFFNRFIDQNVLFTLEVVAKEDYEVITYTDAMKLLAESGKKFEFPVSWGADLQSEHERYLCEEVFRKPVIIIDYPKDIKPFYMKLNDDEKTVRAMDVLVPRVGEIIGGSQREDGYDVLVKRMEETGINPEDYWWYLDLRRFGSAPHSGFGLGLERLIQFITGLSNIRDVIPFPRTPGNLEF